MAAYTSYGDGNWDAAATWGGGGYPSSAGDTATIATGHTVTYNISSTTELGTITVYGLLTFSLSANTKLALGNASISIGAAGELRVGNAANSIPAAYTAEITFNTTSDNANGIYGAANGATINIFGDPAYYGSDFATYLYANWTSGTSFDIEGNYSSKWVSGQKLIVHKLPATYASATTDIAEVTISGAPTWDGTKTTITIAEAFPTGTFNAGGRVLNISRNVKLSKVGYTTTLGQYNSNRPKLYGQNVGASIGKTNLSNVEFGGFYGVGVQHSVQDSCVYRNGNSLSYSGSIQRFTNIIALSLGQLGYGGHRSYISGYGCGNAGGFGYSSSLLIEDFEWFANSQTLFAGFNVCCHLVDSYVYGNTYGLYPTGGKFVNCVFGYNRKGTSCKQSSADLFFWPTTEICLDNCKPPSTGYLISGINTIGYHDARIKCHHHNQTRDTHVVYDTMSTTTKVVADGLSSRPSQRAGGNADVLEIYTQSNNGATNWAGYVAYSDVLRHSIYCSNGVAVTVRYYVQTDYTGTPALSATEIYLGGTYLTGTNGETVAITASDETVATRSGASDWSQYLEVTFTPGADGWVNLYLRTTAYEAAKYIWVDPLPVVTGASAQSVVWVDGQTQLQARSGGGCALMRRR